MDTIVAISTPAGSGGIAVVRLSGPEALAIADSAWRGARLSKAMSHTVHLGQIVGEDGDTLDRAVATLFRGPNSFTGEDTVEFSVHGSRWIQRKVVELLIAKGARAAGPGEFTQRAFLNGRMDLAQAEAVADLIASSSRAAHRLAMTQMSGAFSRRLDSLRDQLITLASLLELELDFSEEEVEFADRKKLLDLADETLALIGKLVRSYYTGKNLKEGVPVAIAGVPNAGKSTLLNLLLDDDKAIVSDIPGTTRDIIEDTREIGGILFRFIDTAGLRATGDPIESLGIQRANAAISRASIIIWLVDSTDRAEEQIEEITARIRTLPDSRHIILLNKSDITPHEQLPLEEIGNLSPDKDENLVPDKGENLVPDKGENLVPDKGENLVPDKDENIVPDKDENLVPDKDENLVPDKDENLVPDKDDGQQKSVILHICDKISKTKNDKVCVIPFSAKLGEGKDDLERALTESISVELDTESELIVTNERHRAALQAGGESLQRARQAIEQGLSADFVAQDIRESLHHLGEVTGAVTTDTLLANIFQNFCIGK